MSSASDHLAHYRAHPDWPAFLDAEQDLAGTESFLARAGECAALAGPLGTYAGFSRAHWLGIANAQREDLPAERAEANRLYSRIHNNRTKASPSDD